MNFSFFQKKTDVKPVVLVVLDGFGIAPPSNGNPITMAKTPNYLKLINNYPHGELIASGESVGLPANEEGNTEVGHLTLGAGRVIYQELKKINLAIENGSFFNNRALLAAASHVRARGSKLHIMGLVSTGRVHSSVDHLYAILQFFKKEDVRNVFVHVFTDGRDAPQKESLQMVTDLEHYLQVTHSGEIASISGRYFAMDRDKRWDRTEKVYKALVMGVGMYAKNAKEAIETAYSKNQMDEFIEPTLIVKDGKPIGLIEDNDGVVFFNFRIDRPRQLAMPFVMPEFENMHSFNFGYSPGFGKIEGVVAMANTFDRQKVPKDLFFVTMTQYHKEINVSDIVFPPQIVENPLGGVIANKNLGQLHMAESEKERFVTYYFNGLRESPYPLEEDVIIQSPGVQTYDQKPEMSLPKLATEFTKKIKSGKFNFGLINFANPDMVAHTGNLFATIKAIESTDKYLGEVVSCVLSMDGTVVITADHGNAEELLTYPTSSFFYTTEKGTINTDHSNNPVPFIVVRNSLFGNQIKFAKKGVLADIAPTILNLMGIPVPADMTGKNLIETTQ